MDILRSARKLESTIAGKLEDAAKEFVRPGPLEPLEIVHAIVHAVGLESQDGRPGRAVAAFNEVTVSVVAASPEARRRLEGAFSGEPTLRDRIVARLRLAGHSVDDLGVAIEFVTGPEDGWSSPDFHLVFASVERHPAPAAPRRPVEIGLTVVRGAAEPAEYRQAGARINLGRGPEVRNDRNRLLRTNHVVFTEESGDVNGTVSRAHAHIAFDEGANGYRLHDDGSGHGSGVVRDGRTIAVPQGTRGVGLRSGDEIVLGEARIAFQLH